MRHRKAQGFTLIELLIVIAIIGILAAVLIPNLLNARRRAFDTASQSCLKNIATDLEVTASNNPWQYDSSGFTFGTNATFTYGSQTSSLDACTNVVVDMSGVTPTTYIVYAAHPNGSSVYEVQAGGGVLRDAGGSLSGGTITP